VYCVLCVVCGVLCVVCCVLCIVCGVLCVVCCVLCVVCGVLCGVCCVLRLLRAKLFYSLEVPRQFIQQYVYDVMTVQHVSKFRKTLDNSRSHIVVVIAHVGAAHQRRV
jgi:hypothetical protein